MSETELPEPTADLERRWLALTEFLQRRALQRYFDLSAEAIARYQILSGAAGEAVARQQLLERPDDVTLKWAAEEFAQGKIVAIWRPGRPLSLFASLEDLFREYLRAEDLEHHGPSDGRSPVEPDNRPYAQ